MQRILISLAFSCILLSSNGQSFQITEEISIETNSEIQNFSILESFDGFTYLVGFEEKNDTVFFTTLKINNNFEIVDQLRINTRYHNGVGLFGIPTSSIQLMDGSHITTFGSRIMKLNSNLEQVWISGTDDGFIYNVIEDANGFIAIGDISGTPSLFRFGNDGTLLETVMYSDYDTRQPTSAIRIANGHIVIGFEHFTEFILLTIGTDSEIIKVTSVPKKIGSSFFSNITNSPDGGILMGTSPDSIELIKLDAGIDIQWTKRYGSRFTDFMVKAVYQGDNLYVIGHGGQQHGTVAASDYYLSQLDFDGNVISEQFFTSNNMNNLARGLTFNQECLVSLWGATSISSNFSPTILCLDLVSDVEENIVIDNPTIFPNPTSSHIQFSCPSLNNLTAEISTSTGTIAGTEIIKNSRIDLTNYPEGIYFLTIKNHNDGATLSYKVIVRP